MASARTHVFISEMPAVAITEVLGRHEAGIIKSRLGAGVPAASNAAAVERHRHQQSVRKPSSRMSNAPPAAGG
jgi:hypothetical protein